MPSTAALDLVVTMRDEASKEVDGLSDSIGGLGKVAGLAGAGVLAFGGFLVGAASAAAEEEQGINRLNTALKNNIPGWDGNTQAVDDYVTKAEDMAFADDKIRDSLTSLVGHTHDLTEAQNLQSLAMDLARGRNIDLATATEIVGKVSDGNVGILKKYGIEVDKNASSTEALGKIHETYAGQAQAYADSTSGSIDRLKTGFGDAMETIGGAVLGIVEGPLKSFTDWVSSPEVRAGIQQVADFIGKGLTAAIDGLGKVIEVVGPPLMSIFQFIGDHAVPIGILIASIIAGVVVPAFITWATTMLTTVLPAFIATMAPIIAAAAPFIALGAIIAGLYIAFETNFLGIRDLVMQVVGVVQPILQPFIDAFQTFFNTIGGGGDFMTALGTLFGGLGDAIAAAGPQILPALATIGQMLWQWVVDTAPKVLEALGTLFAGIIQWIGDNGPGILATLGQWAQAFGAWVVNDALPWLFTNLGNLIGAVIQWIGDNGPGILAKLWGWAQAFGQWIINDALPWLFENLGNLISAIWTWIVDNGPTILAKLGEWAAAFMDWITNDVLPFIGTKLGEIATALWNWITTTAGDLLSKLVNEWIPAFWNWITGPGGVIENIGAKLGEIWTSITTWVTQTAKDVFDAVLAIGQGIVDGISKGVSDAWQGFLDWIMGLIHQLPQPILDFFGIKSPSTLFAEIGENLVLGLKVGWDNKWDSLTASILKDIKDFGGQVPALLPGDRPGGAVLPGDYPGGGALLPGDYPGGAVLPGDYRGPGAVLPGDYPGGALLPGDYPGGALLPGDYHGRVGGGGSGGGRMLGATMAGGSGGGMSIGQVIIYASPGTNGRQVALDFIDGISEQLGLSERTRRPAVHVR